MLSLNNLEAHAAKCLDCSDDVRREQNKIHTRNYGANISRQNHQMAIISLFPILMKSFIFDLVIYLLRNSQHQLYDSTATFI